MITARALWQRVAARPWAVAILVMLVATVLIRPFGDYPLNDDWHYARIAKNFAEKGKFALDSPVASALVGQSLIAMPVIKLFGFSHSALHILTMLLGFVGLWALDRLMELGGVAPRLRLLALLTVALNPLFFYTAISFMTEFYGYVPGLLAAVWWFSNRRTLEQANADPAGQDAPALSWTAAIACGLLFGCTFWVRQFCAAIYPALPGATVFGLLIARRYKALYRTLPRLALSAACYAVVVLSFFPWAKATGNYTAQFQGPLGNLKVWEGETFFKHAMLWLVYMAVFYAPLLLVAPWRVARWRALGATGAVLIAATFYARWLLRDVRMDWLHPHMPFLGNIIEDTGLGPITLSDVYWAKLQRPRWSPETWAVIEAFSVHAVALFAPLIVGFPRIVKRLRNSVPLELLLFGLLVILGSVGLSIQAYKMETLDRYHFPSLLVMPLVIAVAASTLRADRRGETAIATHFPSPPLRRLLWASIALLPVAWFSIAGLHDYFRWNDARWQLRRDARRFGATDSTTEGGYEMNGWLHFDDQKAGHAVTGCVGPCRCEFATWYTQDCSFHIGMNVFGTYDKLMEIQPSYWLAPGPPMVLSKRRPR